MPHAHRAYGSSRRLVGMLVSDEAKEIDPEATRQFVEGKGFLH